MSGLPYLQKGWWKVFLKLCNFTPKIPKTLILLTVFMVTTFWLIMSSWGMCELTTLFHLTRLLTSRRRLPRPSKKSSAPPIVCDQRGFSHHYNALLPESLGAKTKNTLVLRLIDRHLRTTQHYRPSSAVKLESERGFWSVSLRRGCHDVVHFGNVRSF